MAGGGYGVSTVCEVSNRNGVGDETLTEPYRISGGFKNNEDAFESTGDLPGLGSSSSSVIGRADNGDKGRGIPDGW